MQRNLRDGHQLADDFNETIRGKFRVSRNNIEPQFYNPLFRHNNSAFAGWMFTHISHPIKYFVLVINPIVAEPLYDFRVAPYWLCGWYEFFSSPITERSIFATTNWIWQLLGQKCEVLAHFWWIWWYLESTGIKSCVLLQQATKKRYFIYHSIELEVKQSDGVKKPSQHRWRMSEYINQSLLGLFDDMNHHLSNYLHCFYFLFCLKSHGNKLTATHEAISEKFCIRLAQAFLYEFR